MVGVTPCALPPVRAAVRAAYRVAGVALPRDACVSIAFVEDETMRALNLKHRRADKTTDVLSFGQPVRRGTKGAAAAARLARDVDGGLDLGDIVISAAQAGRQAKRRGHPLVREIAFLAAHGALHLLGFEDETPAGYREMVRLGNQATGARAR